MKIAQGKEQRWEEWKTNNQDPYGAGVIRYVLKWADLMESEIENGKEVKDIADETSNKADIEGITGFMYGCAVKILADIWEHGEELRKWHNKEYNYNGNGVVNPAILTIKIDN